MIWLFQHKVDYASHHGWKILQRESCDSVQDVNWLSAGCPSWTSAEYTHGFYDKGFWKWFYSRVWTITITEVLKLSTEKVKCWRLNKLTNHYGAYCHCWCRFSIFRYASVLALLITVKLSRYLNSLISLHIILDSFICAGEPQHLNINQIKFLSPTHFPSLQCRKVRWIVCNCYLWWVSGGARIQECLVYLFLILRLGHFFPHINKANWKKNIIIVVILNPK